MFFFGGGVDSLREEPYEKTKGHIHARVRVVRAIMRENPSTGLTYK